MRTQPELGKFIAKLRLDRGMTQAELANSLCVARSTLAGYERGSIQPTTFILTQIADRFDIDIKDLLGIETNRDIVAHSLDLFGIIERLTHNVKHKHYNKYRARTLTDEDLEFLELQLKNLISTMELYLSNKR